MRDPKTHTLGPQTGSDFFKISSGSVSVHEKELSSGGALPAVELQKSLNHFSNKIKATVRVLTLPLHV